MAKERLSMRKIKEVLRLHFEHQQSIRQIAKSCNIARSTIQEYLHRAEQAEVTWPLPPEMDDATLENRLFPPAPLISPEKRQMPPMEYLHQERKKKGVTLMLLWHEYKQANPDGYQYSQFCERYRQWEKKLDVCLRQEYRAGEKLFVDYAGQTIPIHDPLTGEMKEAYLFVATLGASNYTFAEATLSRDLPSWIQSHVHAFDFFGGVPEILIPDNLKTGVTHPCRYEPDLNPTYLDLAEHYGTVVIPTRVGKPKDKAKVESAVLIAERWILAALRNFTFFSLEELNQAIAEKLKEFNLRKFQKLDTTRKELFETLDRPALKPLPQKPYEYTEWKKATVNIDYHIEVDHHYYSVPYQLVNQTSGGPLHAQPPSKSYSRTEGLPATPAVTAREVSPLSKNTCPRPTNNTWNGPPPGSSAGPTQIGPNTEKLVTHILENKPHPQQGSAPAWASSAWESNTPKNASKPPAPMPSPSAASSTKVSQSILKKGLDQKHALLPKKEEATPSYP